MITDSQTDQPISNAVIEIEGFSSTRTISDAQGKFVVGPAKLSHIGYSKIDPAVHWPKVPDWVRQGVVVVAISHDKFQPRRLFPHGTAQNGDHKFSINLNATNDLGTVVLNRKSKE